MKKAIDKPWLEPGYTFSIGWPPGFVPQPLERSAVRDSEIATATRQAALAKGNTGTLQGRPLSKRTQAANNAIGKAMVAAAKARRAR